MSRLAKLGRSFLYDRGENNVWMYDGATGGVNHYTRTELMRAIHPEINKQTLHIVDSREQISSSPCNIVFVCSPRLEHESDLHKINLQRFYMPRWELNEIESCRSEFYKNLPQDLVKELFRRWNGVPRFVLQKADFSWSKYSFFGRYWKTNINLFFYLQGNNLANQVGDGTQQRRDQVLLDTEIFIHEAVDNCDLSDLEEYAKMLSTNPQISNRILHVLVSSQKSHTFTICKYLN